MFNENTLRQAISIIDNYHSLDKIIEEETIEEIAEKLGISTDEEVLEKFEEFCGDYDKIREQKSDGVLLANKQFSEHQFDVYRILKNSALSAFLGLFADQQLYGVLSMAGAGMAVTAYDEAINKGTMHLEHVWLSTFFGCFIGSFFGEGETWKYVGAGIGAVLSTAYEAQQGLTRKVTPNKPKEEVLQDVEQQYITNLDNLLKHYTS